MLFLDFGQVVLSFICCF